MTTTTDVLELLACPLGDSEAVRAAVRLAPDDVLKALAAWIEQVFRLCREPRLERIDRRANDELLASLTRATYRRSVLFRVIDEDELIRLASEEVPVATVYSQDADVVVVCVLADPEHPGVPEGVRSLQRRAGAPLPTFIVMDPQWLAAAVVNRFKPFSYPALARSEGPQAASQPYFTDVPEGGSRTSTHVSRVRGTLREAVRALVVDEAPLVYHEPTSLPEKVREEGNRIRIPRVDVMVVTTFLTPITHSRSAMARYYARDRADDSIVRPLVDARQDADRSAWEAHVAEHRYIEVLDRQQIEEYFVEPDYYQLTLTPEELDEQVAAWTALFHWPNYALALCPEPIDITFRLEGPFLEIRGDRRNKSEPRAGRLNGLRFEDPAIAEEFRREAFSLIRLTEPHFTNKDFIEPWVRELAHRYRRSYRRMGN